MKSAFQLKEDQSLDVAEENEDAVCVTNTPEDQDVFSLKGWTLSQNELQILHQMNEQFAHVIVSGKNLVVSSSYDNCNNRTFALEQFTEFEKRFLHKKAIAKMNLGKAWLCWNGKRFYPDGIIFAPGSKNVLATQMNLFVGYSKTPRPGDVSFFLKHVKEVICSNNEVHTKYVLQFFAHLLQKPHEKPTVAIVQKSIEGTGKSSLIKMFSAILGQYAITTNGIDLFTQRFNSILENKLLIFVDEAYMRGQKESQKLKALISENAVNIERKTIDSYPINSFARYIFATNNDHVLNAGSRERRYLVLEPSTKYAQNQQYFSEYQRFCDENSECVMHYLLELDISDFNPRVAPFSESLLDEKIVSLTPALSYFYEALLNEFPAEGTGNSIHSYTLYTRFSAHLEKISVKMTPAQMRSTLGKLCRSLGMRPTGRAGRDLRYEFGSVEELRASFAARLGEKVEDLFK